MSALHHIQHGIGQALAQLQAVARRPNASFRRISLPAPTPHRSCALTLLRLRHDIIMIGRAAIVPLPKAFATRLASPLAQIAAAFADYMRSSSAALLARRSPSSLDAIGSALAAYETEIAALRREGLTRGPFRRRGGTAVRNRIALEQMHMNFKDLERCIAEWADWPKSREPTATEGTRN